MRNRISVMALGVALALGATTAAAPAFAQKAKKEKPVKAAYTPAVQSALAAAQKALQANDLPTAQAKLAEAKPLAVTDDDKYGVGSIQLGVAQKTNDQAQLSEAIDLMLASNKVAPDNLNSLLIAQGKFAYQARNMPKAEAAFQRAMSNGSTDNDLLALLAESKAQQGKAVEAVNLLNDGIAKRNAAGQTTPPEWYGRALNIALAAKNVPPQDKATLNTAVGQLSEKWLAAYPTRTNWRDALVIYRDNNRIESDQEIDLMRLMRANGSLKGERDYMEYVLATYLRFPGEAKAVLDEGVASGQLNLAASKNATEINGIVKGKIAADKASLPASDKSARAAANGKSALSTADAYYGYNDYAKAAELYRVALEKGGVDANTANTRLGMALARSGDKEGARAAFAKVTGTRTQLAKFWTIYLDHPATA